MADDEYKENVSTIAKMAGLHRDTVRKRLNEAGINPCGKRGNAPIYRLAEAMQCLFASTVISADALDPNKLDPKGRLDWYRSESERVKFAQTVRELIPSAESRDEQSKTLKVVAAFFDSMPDKLERKRIFTPDQLEAVEKLCDEMRAQLYAELMEISD
ncbi:MAG: DUF1441 family protein [Aeromonas veronii]